ncbi:13461_t:CDS:1, partial [Racocetra fulgida]
GENYNLFNFQNNNETIMNVPIYYNSIDTNEHEYDILLEGDNEEKNPNYVLNYLCNVLEE